MVPHVRKTDWRSFAVRKYREPLRQARARRSCFLAPAGRDDLRRVLEDESWGAILRVKELNIDRALPLRLRLSRALLGDCVMREVMGGFRRQPNIFSSHIRSQSGQTRTHVRNATTLFQDQLVIVAGASNGWWRRRRDVAD